MSELFPFATEHLVEECKAKRLSSFIWPELTEIWAQSYREWNSMSERHRGMLAATPFVPPVTVFGFCQAIAKEVFTGREDEGIEVCDKLGVFAISVNRRLLLRFNGVDRDFRVRNTEGGTVRKSAYYRQEPIPGLGSATRLTVGCLPTPARSEIQAVVLSCQVGNSLHYTFRIDGGDDAILPLPNRSTPPRAENVSDSLKKKKPR